MNKNLLELFDEQVHTIPGALYNTQTNYGNRPANILKEEGKWRIVTYNEMISRVEKLAIGLIRLGLSPEDRVGIKGNTSARWTWADLGTLFAGAATVSLYPNLNRAETTAVVKHSNVKLLFVDNQQRLDEINSYRSDMPSLQYLVCLQKGFRGNGQDVFSLGELIRLGSTDYTAGLVLLKNRLKSLRADSPAAVVYTSGTVGALKAGLFSHKDILNSCTRVFKHLAAHGQPLDYNLVSLVLLPVSHIMEKIHGYFSPLLLGGTLGFASSYENLLMDIATIRPTWLTWVPRLAAVLFLSFQKGFMSTKDGRIAWEKAMDVAVRATKALEDHNGYINLTIPIPDQLEEPLRQEWIESYNSVYWRFHHVLGGQLKNFIIGAAYLDIDLQRKLVGMGLPIILGYGLTESAAGIALSCPDKYKIGWISPPTPGVEFRQNEDGELLIKGLGVIDSYYNNIEATRESVTSDGWFKTGDIAEMDDNGYIRIVDRKKLLIVLDNGKKISQARLEALCGTSPLIDQVAIVGQDREYISALIVPNYDFILRVLRSHGIPFDESQVVYQDINDISTCVEVGMDIMQNDLVRLAMQDQIDMINSKLREYETIKTFRLMRHRFCEEDGELSHANKLKMKTILEKYQDVIEDMYRMQAN